MTTEFLNLTFVDEPQQWREYADIASLVAGQKKTVIMRRDGVEFAAIIPLECLEVLQDVLAMEEAQRIARTLDLPKLAR